MSERHQALSLSAAAAMQEQIMRAQALQIAIMRGAEPQEIERLRQAVVDQAEVYADLMAEVARARVRAIIG